MLTKTEFVKAVNAIKEKEERIHKEIKNRDLILCLCDYSLQDPMISLLESAMAIPVDEDYGSIISWWIYENDYGKEGMTIEEKDERGKITKVKIKTPEELYDYCKDMSIED